MAGIVGYGAHLPRHRIKVEEIAKVWGADAPSYKKGLMLREKSVPPPGHGHDHAVGRGGAQRPGARADGRPPGHRRHLYRLGIASVRREAVRHGGGGGDRRHAGHSLRRFRVRLQGRVRGDVRRAQSRRHGEPDEIRAGDRRGYVAGRALGRARILRRGRRGGLHHGHATTWSPSACTRTRT